MGTFLPFCLGLAWEPSAPGGSADGLLFPAFFLLLLPPRFSAAMISTSRPLSQAKHLRQSNAEIASRPLRVYVLACFSRCSLHSRRFNLASAPV